MVYFCMKHGEGRVNSQEKMVTAIIPGGLAFEKETTGQVKVNLLVPPGYLTQAFW